MILIRTDTSLQVRNSRCCGGMRDQLLPDKGSKGLPRVAELVDEAAAIAALPQLRSATPPTPKKVYATHFKKYLRPDQPAMRIKHSATPRSDVLDAAKPLLIFEYLEVKAANGRLGRIKDLAAHCQLQPRWFKDNADKFHEASTFESARIGSRGGERKFDAEMAS